MTLFAGLFFLGLIPIRFFIYARNYKLGEITDQTEHEWFVIPGYGQLAQYFIKKYKVLENAHTCVIAPEGLSRFYVNELQKGGSRTTDRACATWMTNENRTTDIRNYLVYLNSVYEKEIGDKKIKSITLLGFSQGRATVSRWALQNHIHFHRIILWARVFPNDMNFDDSEALKSKKIIQVHGTKDHFIIAERLRESKAINDNLTIHPEIITVMASMTLMKPL